MINVLLTGSSGFLGNHIYNSIKSKCHLYTLNRFSGNYIFNLNYEIPKFNNSFDLIIHSAGTAHVESNNKITLKDIYTHNLNITKNLLKSINSKPKTFVFISSVAVYGLDYGININENYPLIAKDSYGLSKIHSEELIINWCKKNNVKCLILRLPLLIGRNPKGNLKKMIDAINLNIFFEIDNGIARKSMLLADDLANNILEIAKYEGIFNLTDGYHPSFHEFGTHLATQLNKKIRFNISYRNAEILAYFGNILGSNFLFNSNKFKKITSTLTFDDNLAKETFNWNPNAVLSSYFL